MNTYFMMNANKLLTEKYIYKGKDNMNLITLYILDMIFITFSDFYDLCFKLK
jgi:hypothetical protein